MNFIKRIALLFDRKPRLVREGEVMLPNGNGVKTKVYRGEIYRPKVKDND